MLKSVYPITAELIEWLNHTLVPMEEAVFHHYRGIRRLVQLVDRAEKGTIPKYAALSAIRDYNEAQHTCLTYAEIRDRSPNYIFTDFGQWAAYLDNFQAANRIIASDYDDPGDAFENAHPDISWIVLWLPSDGVAVVYRSPHTARRDIHDEEAGLADGLTPGGFRAYTLPPELEASLGLSDPEEILGHHPHNQSWSRADAR